VTAGCASSDQLDADKDVFLELRVVPSEQALVAVLLALLISFVGIAWVDYDVPGVWPDLIGPSKTRRVEGVAALECAYRPGGVVGSHSSSPWTIWPGPLCRQ
jgi:hypothetical protein